ncbi:replication initiation protein, partial [Aeromonas sp. 102P]|uniref:replication initiation protein n=1 Tax=Aeromonas sp. 102P TaxID=3452711 RepID=UPI003F7A0C14
FSITHRRMSPVVFDVDVAQECRAPHWIAINPENGNYHLGYLLAAPVARTNAARLKPLRYLAAIEHVLAKRLGADMGYVGLITKNPVHSDWWTVWHNHAPYSLDYLAEFCPDADLAAYNRRSGKEVSGLGRNVTVFDSVREWGYSAVREYWRPNGYEAWAEAVRVACESANAFGREQGGPLPHSEIKATAKSIARWIWRHLTPTSFADYVDRTHTPEIQAIRGAKGGRIGGKVSKGGGRPKSTNWALWEAIQSMKAAGYPHSTIADDLNISASTVSKYAKISK